MAKQTTQKPTPQIPRGMRTMLEDSLRRELIFMGLARAMYATRDATGRELVRLFNQVQRLPQRGGL